MGLLVEGENGGLVLIQPLAGVEVRMRARFLGQDGDAEQREQAERQQQGQDFLHHSDLLIK